MDPYALTDPMADSRDDSAKLSLGPARRQKLTESVVEQLLDAIRQRGLGPGTRMPSERELQNLLGVGRSTVREAMTGLAALGVVEIRHGQGAFIVRDPAVIGATDEIVAALSKGITLALLEARRPVEIEVARLAALRRSESDLNTLRGVLRDHQHVLETGQPAGRVSAQFHVALSEAAHNEVLAGFVASYRRLLIERGPPLEQLPGYRQWEFEEHRKLFTAVEAQDPVSAARLMREHLDAVTEYHSSMGWALEPRSDSGQENADSPREPDGQS